MSNVSKISEVKQLLSHEKIVERMALSMNNNQSKMAQFQSSLLQAIGANEKLQECNGITIIQSALVAASLNLPIDPNLGFAYIIPYKDKKKGMVAQFQMGYKGFIQLALRSKTIKNLNTIEIREGELVNRDMLTGEIEFAWIDDESMRIKKPVIGYAAFVRTHDGFEKTIYASRESVEAHAKKYSQSYRKGWGPWVDDFNSMALKTMVKRLLTTWAQLSVSSELANAAKHDQAVIDEEGNLAYLDNDKGLEEDWDGIDENEIKEKARESEIEEVASKVKMPKAGKATKTEEKEV